MKYVTSFREQGSALEESIDTSTFILKHRIPIITSKTALKELKGTKAERMGCVTNLKEQGHVSKVTASICTVVIALEMKDLSQIIGKCLTKEFLTSGNTKQKRGN